MGRTCRSAHFFLKKSSFFCGGQKKVVTLKNDF